MDFENVVLTKIVHIVYMIAIKNQDIFLSTHQSHYFMHKKGQRKLKNNAPLPFTTHTILTLLLHFKLEMHNL